MSELEIIVIGHRGAKGLAPENSLESIRKAMSLGVEAIELDLRMQANVVVLSHDSTLKSQIYCPLAQALKEIGGKTVYTIKDWKVY